VPTVRLSASRPAPLRGPTVRSGIAARFFASSGGRTLILNAIAAEADGTLMRSKAPTR
jgi:hypothetical protein